MIRQDFSVHRCKDCELAVLVPMYVYKRMRKRPYCPKCGENIYVEHVRNVVIDNPLGGKKRIYTTEEEEDLIEYYNRGYTFREIGEILDREGDSLRQKIRRLRKQGRV